MKKTLPRLLVCIIAALMMGMLCAQAEGMGDVAASRIHLWDSTGLSVADGQLTRLNETTDGLLSFRIHSDKIDWTYLALYQSANNGVISVSAYIDVPADAVNYVSVTYGGDVDDLQPPTRQQMQDQLDRVDREWGYEPINPGSSRFWRDANGDVHLNLGHVIIANYLKDAGVVSMRPRYTFNAEAYRWYRADGTYFDEMIVFDFEHTNPAAQPVQIAPIALNRLTPMSQYSDEEKRAASFTYSGEDLVYQLPASMTRLPETQVLAPADATHYKITHSTGYSVNHGSVTPIGDDRRITLQLGENDRAERFTIDWIMPTGEKREGITITATREGALPYPAYLTSQKTTYRPVDAKVQVTGDGHVIETKNLLKNGVLHWAPTENYRANAPLEDARMYVTIDAPDGAVRYQCAGFNVESGLFQKQHDAYIDDDIIPWLRDTTDFDEESVPSNGKVVHEIWPFIKDSTDGTVTIYQPNIYGGTSRGAGDVFFYAWLDASGKLISIDWMAVYSDPFVIVRQGKRRASESDVSPTNTVQFVTEGEWTLECSYKPQYAENAISVELDAYDLGGVKTQPGEPTVFYLPYPDGLTFEMGATYTLLHYDAAYETYASVPVEATPNGLRFETDSLSPFELLWDVPATLPKTGDSTPIALWLALMALSVIGAGLMRRRAKA